jgi:hypothetical protein
MHVSPWRKLALTALLTPLLALAPAPGALASSGPKCNESDQYGASCIDLTGDGRQLKDVQAYFVPPNRDYLTHRKWKFKLTSYTCDPRGHTLAECPINRKWFTKARKGNPPKNGSQCATLGLGGSSLQNCVDIGLANANASLGDWPSFYRLPHSFHKDVWFCSEVAVRVHGHWVTNGAPGTPGNRGCAEVHG